jgi:LmbE family N-acetylglucosaminyl deacetylase
MKQLTTPRTAVVIVAHPDDAEYLCGGTVAAWARQGCAVTYIVVTSGDKGIDSPEIKPQEAMRIREAEQLAAAKALGVKTVEFLRHRDCELTPTLELRQELVAQLRRHRPQVIFTHDPLTRYYRMHPDHRVVGQVALEAAFPAASVRFCLPELSSAGLEPHAVECALLFNSDIPDFWVDISATLEIKLKALQEHRSQENSFPGGMERRLVNRATRSGQEAGVQYAEDFKLVDLVGGSPLIRA